MINVQTRIQIPLIDFISLHGVCETRDIDQKLFTVYDQSQNSIVSNTGHPPMPHHFFSSVGGGYVVSYINKKHLKWLQLSC